MDGLKIWIIAVIGLVAIALGSKAEQAHEIEDEVEIGTRGIYNFWKPKQPSYLEKLMGLGGQKSRKRGGGILDLFKPKEPSLLEKIMGLSDDKKDSKGSGGIADLFKPKPKEPSYLEKLLGEGKDKKENKSNGKKDSGSGGFFDLLKPKEPSFVEKLLGEGSSKNSTGGGGESITDGIKELLGDGVKRGKHGKKCRKKPRRHEVGSLV